MRTKLLAAVAATLAFAVNAAFAATTTSTFQVRATITATCAILASPDLDFGSLGVLTANAQQSSTIQVQCTNTTPYNIGLNAGTGSGASVATRKLSNGGAVINYSLYTDSAHTIVWGNTIGTDTVSATGSGASQSYPVYGLIPPQTTPAPGSYTDTITVTVTY
jgi:spore coat protein U-like protein